MPVQLVNLGLVQESFNRFRFGLQRLAINAKTVCLWGGTLQNTLSTNNQLHYVGLVVASRFFRFEVFISITENIKDLSSAESSRLLVEKLLVVLSSGLESLVAFPSAHYIRLSRLKRCRYGLTTKPLKLVAHFDAGSMASSPLDCIDKGHHTFFSCEVDRNRNLNSNWAYFGYTLGPFRVLCTSYNHWAN